LPIILLCGTIRRMDTSLGTDDDLARFDAEGALPLPPGGATLEHDGASIWYAAWGEEEPIILLHGGLGNAGNWGYQVPALLSAGHRVVVIDSRGHGRSTRDGRPYSYELMAGDVLAMMDRLGIARAAIVGWSDGACTGLVLARLASSRVAGVLYFGCNMDPSGTLPFEMTTAIGHCVSRHRKDYAALSATPDAFDDFAAAVGLMQRTQPDWSAANLAEIAVPVSVVQAERDEFIRREHAEYLAATIPGASYTLLEGVSHFAPLQRPQLFDGTIMDFLGNIAG
jgi:pimeloyl-ACP methyl ester carboxylesterase